MSYKYRKSYRTKKKKSIFNVLKNKFFWLGLLILTILSSLTYFFIFSSVFQVKNIQVLGTEKVSNQEIKNIVLTNVKNIFLVDFEMLNKDILERYSQVAKINFKRKLPDKILVQIEERKAALVFCQSVEESFLRFRSQKGPDNCFLLDSQGIIFEKIDQLETKLLILKTKIAIYRFHLGQEIISRDYIEKIIKIESQLKNKVRISEVSLISENRLNIKTLENWEIYFNPQKDIDWQIEELEIVLKEKISQIERENLEYIDLRFEKIYIKGSN